MIIRNIRRKLVNVALALVCATGLTLGFTTPASASYVYCTPGANAGLPFSQWFISQWPTGRCYTLSTNAGNNQWTSFFNDFGSGIDVLVYKEGGCNASTGLAFLLNGDYGNISTYLGSSWNNNISSVMFMY
jgi:hypothetical protein